MQLQHGQTQQLQHGQTHSSVALRKIESDFSQHPQQRIENGTPVDEIIEAVGHFVRQGQNKDDINTIMRNFLNRYKEDDARLKDMAIYETHQDFKKMSTGNETFAKALITSFVIQRVAFNLYCGERGGLGRGSDTNEMWWRQLQILYPQCEELNNLTDYFPKLSLRKGNRRCALESDNLADVYRGLSQGIFKSIMVIKSKKRKRRNEYGNRETNTSSSDNLTNRCYMRIKQLRKYLLQHEDKHFSRGDATMRLIKEIEDTQRERKENDTSASSCEKKMGSAGNNAGPQVDPDVSSTDDARKSPDSPLPANLLNCEVDLEDGEFDLDKLVEMLNQQPDHPSGQAPASTNEKALNPFSI